MRQLQQLAHGHDAGQVGQIEAPAQGALDLDRSPRRRDAGGDAGGQAADASGRTSAGAFDRVPQRAGLVRQAAADLVVEVGRAGGVRALALRPQEQRPLGRVVLVDGVVVVEVVAGEVGEQGRREARARRPPLGERVGGHLHRARRVAGVPHPGQQRLQLERRRGWCAAAAPPRPPTRASIVPISPQRSPGRLEHRADQVGRRGLAVGAGDADDVEVASDGWPASAAAASAMPTRVSATTAWGTASSSAAPPSPPPPRGPRPRARSRGRRRGCREGRRTGPPGPRPRRGGRSRRWAWRRPPPRAATARRRCALRGPPSISSWRVMRARDPTRGARTEITVRC